MLKWLNPTYRWMRCRYIARYRQWEDLRRELPEEAHAQLEKHLERHDKHGALWNAADSLLHLLDLSAMRGEP